MPVKLKPLSEQVIVITGASSGIGLATARKAAKAGAAVVLAAR
ncbi:MAG: SDR family NAD(P)-dependent oxidoreductase, partial [Phenylobacterium sp.]|nr:SDR family NAD(P)-dependent oxidoreductase [Phenylobacterium sp.]